MRDAIRLLTQILATQAGRQDRGHEYPDRAASARALDFLTLDPPEFKGTDSNADPQEFIDSMQRTLNVMKASATESEMEDRVHRYVMGLEPGLQEACMAVAMQPGMDIARTQAYAQGSEDRRRQREAISEQSSSQPKRARSEGQYGRSTSESRPQYSAPLQFRGSQWGRETFLRQGQSSSYVSGSQQQVGSGREVMPRPLCATCGKRHVGRCRQGVCYTCGDPGHYARDCPQRVGNIILENSVAASSSSVRAPEIVLGRIVSTI
ncbi:uncharacterized protein LOC132620061 [Lycium barbarum]|uniref:uncharacterized protein LOC132620061 n=1 Tax=Lycium barbarum TaxID=112863 RepID=UPI00293E8B90|nr:uncharacterized protein LOC132620061 [Lycium barbarum]